MLERGRQCGVAFCREIEVSYFISHRASSCARSQSLGKCQVGTRTATPAGVGVEGTAKLCRREEKNTPPTAIIKGLDSENNLYLNNSLDMCVVSSVWIALLVFPLEAAEPSETPLDTRGICGSAYLPGPFYSSKWMGLAGQNNQLSVHLPVCRHNRVASAVVLWSSRRSRNLNPSARQSSVGWHAAFRPQVPAPLLDNSVSCRISMRCHANKVAEGKRLTFKGAVC